MGNFIYEKFIAPLFFLLDAEIAHNGTIKFLNFLSYLPYVKSIISAVAGEFKYEKIVNGVRFKNPVGLAAGFDKNGEVYDIMAELGFGFIEIGTVTLKPQAGNPRPRLFRIPENLAVINRMGFNNQGAYAVAKNIEKKGKIEVPLGINIGKNTETPLEEAYKDYVEVFKILREFGDYFVLNISCPNIKDLRKLHNPDFLKKIIESVLEIEQKPFFLKISPDVSDEEITTVVKICLDYKIGIISGNTTTLRSELSERWQKEAGGLSGKPLNDLSFKNLLKIREISKDIPLISCGGIMDRKDFEKRMENGADLIQVYTAMIYKGPFLLKDFFISQA